MPIANHHRSRNAYHFTSIENLESIIDHGIYSTNRKIALGIEHANVAEQSIQDRRAQMLVPGADGRTVHDYVPFYFAKKTPMQLAVLNKKNIDQQFIIYLSVPVSLIETIPGVYFTDASANTAQPPNFYSINECHELDNLDWEVIDDDRWRYEEGDEKHRKMAEFLIPDHLSLQHVNKIITWNQSFIDAVKEIFRSKGVNPPPIEYAGYQHYFLAPPDWVNSIITGPYFLNERVENTISEIITFNRTKPPKFQSLREGLLAVRQELSAIKELGDIDGLRANYGPHRDDVGTHSRRVAESVVGSPEYALLDQVNRDILELSAYLHDIGKGPKNRWPKDICGNHYMNRPDSDHAAESLPMLKAILTEYFPFLPRDTVRKIVMLVTYDDLLGDIAANGRDKSQLFEIVTCAEDIHMLVAISKADIGSLDNHWLANVSPDIDLIRDEVLRSLEVEMP
jgi:hypothetical protein